MTDLTPEAIAHLRELDAARTQGEWFWHSYRDGGMTLAVPNVPFHEMNVLKTTDDWSPSHADAEFIAAAANHMSALLDAAEERDKAKRAAKTLGGIVEQNGRMILDITGLHDWIDEDGDGDWGAVWENAYELLPRIKAAEAEVSRLRAELTICERTSQRNAEAHMAEHKRANDNARKLAATRERAEKAERELAEARAVIERVTALADEFDRRAEEHMKRTLDPDCPEGEGPLQAACWGARTASAKELRVALAPVTQREEGEG